MLSKLKKKGKKGFTLVELIVVIAIIAILAAVAIPTTIHFVEQANISAEQQNIGIDMSTIITTAAMTGFDFNTTFVDTLNQEINSGVAAKIEKIVVTVEKGTADMYKITWKITGKTYGEKSKVEKTLTEELSAGSIFKGVDPAPATGGTFTYVFTDGAWALQTPAA